jgi:hypothetical protein
VLAKPPATSHQDWQLSWRGVSTLGIRSSRLPRACGVPAVRTYGPEDTRETTWRGSSRVERLSASCRRCDSLSSPATDAPARYAAARPPTLTGTPGDDRSPADPSRNLLRLPRSQDPPPKATTPAGSDTPAATRRGTPPHATFGHRNVLRKVTATGLRVGSDLDG